MENYGLITTTVSSIVNSVVLLKFIVPGIERLKEIKNQLLDFGIRYSSDVGSHPEKRETAAESRKQYLIRLRGLLDKYDNAYKDLRTPRTLYSVLVAVALAGLASALWRFAWATHWMDLVAVVGLGAIQLVFILLVTRSQAVTPKKLREADYLVRDLSFNPHVLVHNLSPHIFMDPAKELGDLVKKQDLFHITLNLELRVFSFRFLFVVSGQNGKVYFVSFGPVTSKTPLRRHLLHPEMFDVFPTGEANVIDIGQFPFNMVKDTQTLEMTFLVFMPFFPQDVLNPLKGTDYFETLGADSNGAVSPTSCYGLRVSDTTQTHQGITYRGEGVKLEDLRVKQNGQDLVLSAVSKFKKGIMNGRKIQSYSDTAGGLLDA